MKISIYDQDLNRIAIIENRYISCLWSEGYNTTESFTLELQATEELKKLVQTDFYVGRDDRKTLMVITSVEYQDKKIVASGKQATRLLDEVAFIGKINAGSNVEQSIISAYNGSSKFPNLEFKSNGLTERYAQQISNKSILELADTLGQATDVGIKVNRDGNKMVAEMYKPTENAENVFGEIYGNIRIDSVLNSTETYKNYAIVLGEGEDASRTRVDVDLSYGGTKSQLIVDARDIQKQQGESDTNYKARLKARGVEKLLECQAIKDVKFTPLTADFGRTYDLGDIITVRLLDFDMILTARIVRFTQTSQNNSTETTIEVGNLVFKKGR